METHNVRSNVSHENVDPLIPFHMVLLKEHTKHELIILTYRITVIATGIILAVLGYLLFSNLVIDYENSKSIYQELNKLAPGTVFTLVGILFCISGITKLMPLPKFDRMDQGKSRVGDLESQVPTLSPIETPTPNGKLWQKNVKPIMEKVANNENITRSDRELLRNWLRTL